MLRNSAPVSLASLLLATLATVGSVGCGCSSDDEASGGASGSGASGGSGGGGAAGTGGTSAGGSGGTAATGGGAGSAGSAASGGAAGSDAGPDGGGDAGLDGGCAGPAPACVGVCASTPPVCQAGNWSCTGPGYEAAETLCDGFDNDCDGTTDEGCPTCAVDLTRVQQNLNSKWDIDFDAQCNAYLTTIISGPDHVSIVPAASAQPVTTYTGNANQNMGFGLVDPDPNNKRVVVAYSCCAGCGCTAKNGLTLLYTCSSATPGCGCAAQSNCPGFLDTPFLPSLVKDTSVVVEGIAVATPTGLAAGPGNTYFVGNWAPETCSTDSTCTTCDPTHAGVMCNSSKPACCDSTSLGRLAEFTVPVGSAAPEFRVVAIWSGEEILSVTSTTSGDALVATKTATGGALHRYTASSGAVQSLKTFSTPAYSVTENRKNGDIYVELLSGSPKLNRLSSAGAVLALPSGVPADPTGNGRLQYGPDGKLYRIVGKVNATATLDVFALP